MTRCAAALLLPLAAAAQSPLTAQLVANDDITAQWTNTQTGIVGALQTTPAGPLAGTTVQVAYGGNTSFARYSCALVASGDGHTLHASSSCSWSQTPIVGSTHADLTLTISTAVAQFASLEVLLQHGGDYPGFSAFGVDVGDDGVIELSSHWGSNSSYQQRRLWIWDFANGDLVVRVRTDQATGWAPQGHSLTLNVRPWAAGTSPAATGSSAIPYIPPGGQYATSTNYALVADAPAQPQHLLDLRAFGLGHFNLFLVSDLGTTAPLQLPPPFAMPSDLLSNVLLFDYGSVTATVDYPQSSPTPREWRLPVPQLPAGLTFYVQHASASHFYLPWFGSSNVVRIDT